MSKAWGGIVPSGGVAFIKMQGLHNHFIIVDGRETPYRPVPAEIVHICKVKTVVEADQLLVIQKLTGNGLLQNGVALNIGNPHAVYFVDDLNAIDVAKYAREIQNDPLFPEKVNVGVAQIVSDDHIRLSVFERPGILTTACGSGACVTTRAAQLLGLTRQAKVAVEMAAGSVEIEIRDDNSAVMTGPVEFCFSGTLSGLEGQPG